VLVYGRHGATGARITPGVVNQGVRSKVGKQACGTKSKSKKCTYRNAAVRVFCVLDGRGLGIHVGWVGYIPLPPLPSARSSAQCERLARWRGSRGWAGWILLFTGGARLLA